MSALEKYKHWLAMCDDDMITAKWLLEGNRLLFCGYLCHLVAEKALKATVAKRTDGAPPKTHDLPDLAERGGVLNALSDEQKTLLKRLTPLQIEARYSEHREELSQTLTKEYCAELVGETERFLCWIKERLER